MQPLLREAEEPASVVTETDETDYRVGEEKAATLFEQMQAEREELAVRQEKLSERERLAEQLAHNARKLQKQLQESEARIRKLLTMIDETEVANVKRLSSLLASVDAKSGAQMLLEMDQDLSTRLLYCMDEREAASLLGEMVKSGGPTSVKRAAVLAERLHKLSEEIKP